MNEESKAAQNAEEEETKKSRLTSRNASEGSDSSIIVSRKRERLGLTRPDLRLNKNSVAIYNRGMSGEQGEYLEVPRMQ